MVNFWPKIKIPLALGIKYWGFQLKKAEGGSWDEKMHKIWKLTVLTVDQVVDRFVRASDLNTSSRFIFFPISFGYLSVLLIQLPRRDFWGHCSRLRASDWFSEARALDLGRLLLCPRVTASFNTFLAYLRFQVCVLLSLPALSPSFLIFWWLLGERRLPLGHRASALLSRLSLLKRRLAKMWGLTRPFSALWRIIRGTSRSALKGK